MMTFKENNEVNLFIQTVCVLGIAPDDELQNIITIG